MSRQDGGPAFPIPIAEIQGHATHSAEFGPYMEGLSIRDYFAAKAMQVIASELSADEAKETLEQAASDAYAIADAMLAERERAR